MDRTESMIHQHLYCPVIRYAVRKEVANGENCQCTKLSNIEYGKLTAKLSEEIPWKKLCVYLVGTYVIRKKSRNKTYI